MFSIQTAAAYPSSPATTIHPAAATSTGSSTSSGNNSQLDTSSLGSTFLKLLTQELQNQDPTAPVDSTQMVGQMISLNQLDQLASINQTLTNQFPTAAGSTTTSSTTSGSSVGAAGVARDATNSAAIQAELQA